MYRYPFRLLDFSRSYIFIVINFALLHAETGIFREKFNAMADDALAPYVARTSAAMALTK